MVFVFYNICKLMVSFFFSDHLILLNTSQLIYWRIRISLNDVGFWEEDLGGVLVNSHSVNLLVFMHSSVICVSTVSFYVNVINILTYKKWLMLVLYFWKIRNRWKRKEYRHYLFVYVGDKGSLIHVKMLGVFYLSNIWY